MVMSLLFCEDLDSIVTGAVYIFMKILIYVACLIMRSCTSLLLMFEAEVADSEFESLSVDSMMLSSSDLWIFH